MKKEHVDKNLHSLDLKNGEILLDGFRVKGVTDIKIESSAASGATELSMQLVVMLTDRDAFEWH